MSKSNINKSGKGDYIEKGSKSVSPTSIPKPAAPPPQPTKK
ncbi:hypothetical protein [Tissierella sp. Yu-01]|nr:hypothetical protein [Tissierella sp. Yu-01]WFA10349.1 hypothetical protein P3962_07295 [Tissierella sp. Yu-01]